MTDHGVLVQFIIDSKLLASLLTTGCYGFWCYLHDVILIYIQKLWAQSYFWPTSSDSVMDVVKGVASYCI